MSSRSTTPSPQPTTRLGRARARARTFLESKWTHAALIFLIAVDAICVLAELSYHAVATECPPHEPEWIPRLGHFSLAVSCLFLLEIPAALFAFGPRYYGLKKPRAHHFLLHLLDAVVVVTTVVLEVTLRGTSGEVGGLLVLLRLWRIVKLVGGVATGVGEWDEEDLAKLDRATAHVERLQAENAGLRARLRAYEGDEEHAIGSESKTRIPSGSQVPELPVEREKGA